MSQAFQKLLTARFFTPRPTAPFSSSPSRLLPYGILKGGLLGIGLFTSPAFAVVSESEFDRSSEQQTEMSLNPATSFFVEKRVLRVHGVKANPSNIRELSRKASQIQIEKDSVDGSVTLRTGELPLNLAEIILSSGKTLIDTLADTSQIGISDALKQEAESLLAQKLIERINTDPTMKFKDGYLALNTERTYFSEDFTSVSFSLFVNGRKINGAEITARFKNGQWVSFVSESFGATEGIAQYQEANLQSLKTSIQKTAQNKLGPAFSKIMSQTSTWVPETKDDSYLLIPAIEATVVDTSGQTYTLTVSEADGQILEFFAHKYNFDGKISGTYYSRHPESQLVTSGLPYVSVKVGGLFSRKIYTADKDGNLKVPRENSIVVKLISPIVALQNNGGKDSQILATDDAVFDPEVNTTAAETTTFFHTSVINDYVREMLGKQKLAWLDQQIEANVNINSSCNAYYNGSINFFKAGSTKTSDGKTLSCNNTGEISDVVYHEWGHGLDDNTGGISDGAFSEAIGDITSMLITNSPEVGPYFITDGSPVRNLDGEYQYPPASDMREVHKEGLIFGSTWYHLTQDLIKKYGSEVGRDTSARLFLKVIYTASRYTQAYDAVQTIDSENGTSKGPNFCLINSAFSRHGLAKKESSCG